MSSPPDFFSLLGLERSFDLDLQVLEGAYFRQQRLYHPDRFAGRPAAERQAALLRSVDINDAYRTLKFPLTRAQYLLHLQGITVGTEQDSIKPDHALLMETMEWREAIDGAGDGAALDNIDRTLSDMVIQTTGKLSQFYRAGTWDSMAHEALRLGYLLKASEAVSQRKQRLGKRVS